MLDPASRQTGAGTENDADEAHRMHPPITGTHHVTAIASDPQSNINFYCGVLGLRLVKRTVNFDDPSAYHLYYGDAAGSPGSLVTFFYWPGTTARGRIGAGQMTTISFSAPASSLQFWEERLRDAGVDVSAHTRLGEEVLRFEDPDRIPLEIVATTNDPRPGWSSPLIPSEHSVRGLHTAELTIQKQNATESLLQHIMGYRVAGSEGARTRYETGKGGPGTFIDIVVAPSARLGLGGAGTVHHIAWSVPSEGSLLYMQHALQRAGHGVSPVRERQYFRSVYYREPGSILFEIATAGPGFAIDEPAASLGERLMLPSALEASRSLIEQSLPPIFVPHLQ